MPIIVHHVHLQCLGTGGVVREVRVANPPRARCNVSNTVQSASLDTPASTVCRLRGQRWQTRVL
eukprot:11831907-Alexandrium_andersonii.AAC.1